MSSIRKRVLPSGLIRWQANYLDGAGKRHAKQFEKKRDAEAWLTQAKHEVQVGTHVPEAASATIAQAARLWLDRAAHVDLERSTIAGYRQHVEQHVVPFIGLLRLARLTVPAARAFEDKLRESGRSPAMIRKVMRTLSSLLADAQERGLVARNVLKDLRSNRRKGKELQAEGRQKGKLKIGVDIPTREEIKAIVGALQGRWRPILLTAVFSGLRASELRGLRWSDVDFNARELRVRQRADRYNAIGRPKSEAGERCVPVPPVVVNALREWRLACPKGELDLVFPTGKGRVESHANILQRGFMPAQVRAGVVIPKLDQDGQRQRDKEGREVATAKYTGLHSLRHFYASWCINRKADGGLELPPKSVQERLGHSSIVMTLTTYAHLFPRGDDTEELAAAERSLLG